MTRMPKPRNAELVPIYAVVTVAMIASFMFRTCIQRILTIISGHFLTMISGHYA